MQLIRRIRVALCGLTGHDDMYRNEPGRLFLTCQTCGRETPGWIIREDKSDGSGAYGPYKAVRLPGYKSMRVYALRQVRPTRRTAA